MYCIKCNEQYIEYTLIASKIDDEALHRQTDIHGTLIIDVSSGPGVCCFVPFIDIQSQHIYSI